MSLYRGAGGASDATDDSTVNAVAGYASAAASSASSAATSATNASNSATAAASSASSAASSASSVATNATNASNSAALANTYATAANSSKEAAATSATTASTKAAEASSSASNASSSASSAYNYAASASASADLANSYQSSAYSSATSANNSYNATVAIYGSTLAVSNAVADASGSASLAATSAAAAEDDRILAEAAVTGASSYASAAQGSANDAQAYATAALSARDMTLAAYDSFDDRYLGVKSSDPTVDNDGNPLIAGSLYFNDQTNMMMLRAGGVWVAAYTSGGSPSFGDTVVNGTLQVTGNTTLSGGTANGVAYLNGSKVLTSGSALTFDGTTLATTGKFSGALNGTVGATTPNTGAFTTLSTTGNTTLGDASTDTVTVNGYMGVGGAGASNKGIYQRNTALTGTAQYGITAEGTFSSAGTSAGVGFASFFATEATSYTVTEVAGFKAFNVTKGAGSTITNQHGLYIADQTQGTNNYGITSLVSSGTNKWNIYASGTAANYFAGNVGIGTNALTGSYKVEVNGALAAFAGATGTPTTLIASNSGNQLADRGVAIDLASPGTGLGVSGFRTTARLITASSFSSTQGGYLRFDTENTSGTLTERMRIDSVGNLLVGMTAAATSSAKTVHLANATAPTANPTGGGVLYVEGGALKYRGSSGTVTTIAAA